MAKEIEIGRIDAEHGAPLVVSRVGNEITLRWEVGQCGVALSSEEAYDLALLLTLGASDISWEKAEAASE